MRTLARLYIGWRLLRLLRPALGLAAIAGVLLSLHMTHVDGAPPSRSGASALEAGAAAGQRDLTGALERAFDSATASTMRR
jgi:hypothetical protein